MNQATFGDIGAEILDVLVRYGATGTLKKVMSDFIYRNDANKSFQIDAIDKAILLERHACELGHSVLDAVLGSTIGLIEEDGARRYFLVRHAYWLVKHALEKATSLADRQQYEEAHLLWSRLLRTIILSSDIGHLKELSALLHSLDKREPANTSEALIRQGQRGPLSFVVDWLSDEKRRQDVEPDTGIKELFARHGITSGIDVAFSFPNVFQLQRGLIPQAKQVELALNVQPRDRERAIAVLRACRVFSPRRIDGRSRTGMEVGEFRFDQRELKFCAPIKPHDLHPHGRKRFHLQMNHCSSSSELDPGTPVFSLARYVHFSEDGSYFL